MKIKETLAVPATTKEVTKDTICDICGLSLDRDLAPYSHRDTEICMTEGYSYYDSGERTKTSFDVCVFCFKVHLIPFLESLGAKPEVTEDLW